MVNPLWPGDQYVCPWTWLSLVQTLACSLFSPNTSPDPILTYCWLTYREQISVDENEFENAVCNVSVITSRTQCLSLLCLFIDSDWLGSGYHTYIHMKLWGYNLRPFGWTSPPSAAFMRQWTGSALVQIMARRLFGAKPLSELLLCYCQFDP